MYNGEYISRDELRRFLNIFPNYFDKAYYSLLYEGFNPREAFEVRYSDIQENAVMKRNGVLVPVSEECLNCLEAANRQKTYFKYQNTANRLVEWPLTPSLYIIKFPDASTGTRAPDYDDKHSRFKVKLMYLKRDKRVAAKFTEKNIWKSGLAAALLPFIEKAGGDVDLAGKQYKKEFDEITAIWGRPYWESKQICKSYLETT